MAFGAVLPTLVLQAQHVASVFSQQLDEDLVLSGYLTMVQHYLPEAKPLEKSTMLLLDHKIALPLARCRHETSLLHSAEVVEQMILFDMEENVQQGQAMSSVGTAEDEDLTGNGRGLTKGEMSELTLVRSHRLWGTFVSQLAVVRARSSDLNKMMQVHSIQTVFDRCSHRSQKEQTHIYTVSSLDRSKIRERLSLVSVA